MCIHRSIGSRRPNLSCRLLFGPNRPGQIRARGFRVRRHLGGLSNQFHGTVIGYTAVSKRDWFASVWEHHLVDRLWIPLADSVPFLLRPPISTDRCFPAGAWQSHITPENFHQSQEVAIGISARLVPPEAIRANRSRRVFIWLGYPASSGACENINREKVSSVIHRHRDRSTTYRRSFQCAFGFDRKSIDIFEFL